MSKLTPDELAFVRRTINAIIANDMATIDRLAKHTYYNRETFLSYLPTVKLTPADIPDDLSKATIVITTGHVDDSIQVFLNSSSGKQVTLHFSRKFLTHDIRLHFLFVIDLPDARVKLDAPPRTPTAAERDSALFREASSYIHAYKIDASRDITAQRSRLTDGEAAVVLGLDFIQEVSNGSISQYLTNSNDAEFALRLFEKLGIEAAASPLGRAKRIIFGGRPIPFDYSERNDILSEWEEANEAEVDRIVREMEGDIGFGEQIESQLGAYVRLNSKEFPRSSH